MNVSPQNPGALNWMLLIGLGVVWGTAFLSMNIALEGLGPLWVATGRIALAAIVLVVGGWLVGQGLNTMPSLRAWVYAVLVGVGALALPFTLLAWGQQHVPSAFAGVAMGTVPLLVLPLVYIFSPEEGIGPRRIAGVALGFVGLMILIGPGAFGDGGNLAGYGRLACVGAAACYAVGSILTRRAPAMPPIAFATAEMVAGTVVLVPITLIVEGVPSVPAGAPLAALIYAAIFPTAIAAFIRVKIITTAGSIFMSLVTYMVPIWAIIFGVSLLGESLPTTLYIALALILAGIGLSQWRALGDAFRR